MATEQIFAEGEEAPRYLDRISSRTATLAKSTMDLLYSFIDDGDDYITAKDKVTQLSNEISTNNPSAKFDFTLGDVQPLKDQVQASTLPHMTQPKKDIVLNVLNLAV